MGSQFSSTSPHYDPLSLVFQDHYILNPKVLGTGCYGEVKAGRLKHSQFELKKEECVRMEEVPIAPSELNLDNSGKCNARDPGEDRISGAMSLNQRLENRMRTSLHVEDKRRRRVLCGSIGLKKVKKEPFAVKILKRRLLDEEVAELENVQKEIDESQEWLLQCQTSKAMRKRCSSKVNSGEDGSGSELFHRSSSREGKKDDAREESETTAAMSHSSSKETDRSGSRAASKGSSGSRKRCETTDGTTSTKATPTKISPVRKSLAHPPTSLNPGSHLSQLSAKTANGDDDEIEQILKHRLVVLKKKRAKLYKETRRIVNMERVAEELLILSECDHKHIVRLVEAFQNRDFVYIIYNRAYGDAFSRCRTRRVTPERVCKKWTKQLLDATKYLSDALVMHRDIKPENVFLKTRRPDGDIVLGDFGMSMKLKSKDEKVEQIAGSAAFLAPETWSDHYQSLYGDFWAIGVTAYSILVGDLPFHQSSHQSAIPSRAHFTNVLAEAKLQAKGERRFCDLAYRLGVDGVILATIVVDPEMKPGCEKVSKGAQEFLARMLEKDWERRMTPEEALRHEWLQ